MRGNEIFTESVQHTPIFIEVVLAKYVLFKRDEGRKNHQDIERMGRIKLHVAEEGDIVNWKLTES